MSTIGKCIKDAAVLSRKDIAMLFALFVTGTVTSLIYLYYNPVYVQHLQPAMLILAVIIFMLLALNVSFVAYKVLSDPDTLQALLISQEQHTPLNRLVVTLAFMNLLAFANFSFLVIGFATNFSEVKILSVSLSLGTWPLFFLSMMTMDIPALASKTKSVCDKNFRTPIASPCGPLIVPNKNEAMEC